MTGLQRRLLGGAGSAYHQELMPEKGTGQEARTIALASVRITEIQQKWNIAVLPRRQAQGSREPSG